MKKKISIISLGCDKNRVDTEKMLYALKMGGHCVTYDFNEAEIIIINTCAFIAPARSEAIDTILEMSEYKKNLCEKLIVTGCFPQKYSDELSKGLEEVDAFLGTCAYETICEVIDSLYTRDIKCPINVEIYDKFDNINRIQTTPLHYAYLKIADGCDNHCTFCTIPSIRGKYISRSMDSLVEEAKSLLSNGVSELILVAQDTTRYGTDLYNKPMLVELIKKLSELDFVWIRIMYCYPELVTDELLNEICNNPKVAKYIDIPLQHIDDGILKLMNRRSLKADIIKLVEKIQNLDTYISVRSTFMVGFPTETDSQFKNLQDFIKKYRLQNVGVFAYCLEEDTVSAKLEPQVSEEVKLQRVNSIGKLHYQNAIKNNKAMKNKIVKVVYEDIDYDRNLFKGRTQFNAPEIDSFVYFKADFVDVGQMYDVKITDYDKYDLIGEIVK